MNCGKPELQVIDITTWPTVAYTEFDDDTRRIFESRMQAVLGYARGDSLVQLEQSTGVDRRQLYRLLRRALSPHPDGRPFGFRALVRYARISDYVRLRAVVVRGERGSRGTVGAFSQLLERYPTLAAWLLLQVKQRRVSLGQINTDGQGWTPGRNPWMTAEHRKAFTRQYFQRCLG
ncbi:hypothetical protein F3J20_11725 [Paraburkholderia sp. Cy-641]|nr:hypothetical protein [Paraburkholderia sp. Cy-641]NIF78058.1 hypothetical protein [Paraburkholderia sp. Cy-641]